MSTLFKVSLINDFARRSFRDSADQDYIAARAVWRLNLDQQFRWLALQSFEKYLKAILVFNRKSAKGLGHNILRASYRVANIEGLEFSLPDDVQKFIEYLADYGPDRYLSHPTHLPRNSILVLDQGIWCVRRYCFYLDGESTPGPDDRRSKLRDSNIRKIHNPLYEQNPHKYRLIGGYIEGLLEKQGPGYQELVWKNFYYGQRKKKILKSLRLRVSAVNPTHSLHPEIFAELEKYVDFSKEVRDLYTS